VCASSSFRTRGLSGLVAGSHIGPNWRQLLGANLDSCWRELESWLWDFDHCAMGTPASPQVDLTCGRPGSSARRQTGRCGKQPPQARPGLRQQRPPLRRRHEVESPACVLHPSSEPGHGRSCGRRPDRAKAETRCLEPSWILIGENLKSCPSAPNHGGMGLGTSACPERRRSARSAKR
jgi:hypothetical protein